MERGDTSDLLAYANGLPSQGGVEIGPVLRRLAAEAPAGTAIVEVGSWLGAGTAQLALGLHGRTDPPRLHTYDHWQANEVQVKKARTFGLDLEVGQDTLPIVKAFLEPFGVPITYHKGNFADIGWTGEPISLYVDDAAKSPRAFWLALKTFGPSWIPGVTRIVLMDYNFWRKIEDHRRERFKVQKEFIESNFDHFRSIEDADPAGTSAQFFSYMRRFDFDGLAPFKGARHVSDYLPALVVRTLKSLRGRMRGRQ